MKSSIVLAIALLLGAVVSFLVAQSLGMQKVEQPVIAIVVAAERIQPGQVITEQHLKLLPWRGATLPQHALSDIKSLEGRVSRHTIYPEEMLMESKLAPAQSAGGLASTISFGKRAITVRVNDVIAVAGFTFPGSFVDVMVNAKDQENRPFSRIVLYRVKVLAVEQEMQADLSKPKVVNAVTLELSPEETQKLDLARNIGVLTLVLRNELDEEMHHASVATLDDIVAVKPRKPDQVSTSTIVQTKAVTPRYIGQSPSQAAPKMPRESVIEMRGIREYENAVY